MTHYWIGCTTWEPRHCRHWICYTIRAETPWIPLYYENRDTSSTMLYYENWDHTNWIHVILCKIETTALNTLYHENQDHTLNMLFCGNCNTPCHWICCFVETNTPCHWICCFVETLIHHAIEYVVVVFTDEATVIFRWLTRLTWMHRVNWWRRLKRCYNEAAATSTAHHSLLMNC